MEADGLVLRTQYDEMPVRVEYQLTDKAKSIIPILPELKKWGEENI
jgi:DNA-binding HxlR family transcriptional regulator